MHLGRINGVVIQKKHGVRGRNIFPATSVDNITHFLGKVKGAAKLGQKQKCGKSYIFCFFDLFLWLLIFTNDILFEGTSKNFSFSR